MSDPFFDFAGVYRVSHGFRCDFVCPRTELIATFSHARLDELKRIALRFSHEFGLSLVFEITAAFDHAMTHDRFLDERWRAARSSMMPKRNVSAPSV